MDNIKEITIANICKISCDDLDRKEQEKWGKIFKYAGQRQCYKDYERMLQPFSYNGQWTNPNNRYNPFNVLVGEVNSIILPTAAIVIVQATKILYCNDRGVKEAETPKMSFRCIICQKEYGSGGMA